MTIAYNNEVKEHCHWWFSYHDKDRWVSKLIQEKFALHFLNRQTHQQLQECKTDGAITTHLLNLTKNRYIKWKNKCKTLKNDLLLANIQLDNKWGSEKIV